MTKVPATSLPVVNCSRCKTEMVLLASDTTFGYVGRCPQCDPPPFPTAEAFAAVLAERTRQDKKWGEQNHSPQWWLAILMEEVGELAQAILETHFDKNAEHTTKGGVENIRKEAVQCAAVAVALIEYIDRHTQRPVSRHPATEKEDKA